MTAIPTGPKNDNASYLKLKRDLENDASLLNYLPYKRATFAPQNELTHAAPYRILYGDMVEAKDQLWIYFTLHDSANREANGSKHNRMITFLTLEAAQQGQTPIRPAAVKDVALASLPFKNAADHYTLMAIAKYFFIRRGVDEMLKFPISVGPFKEDLVRACKRYQTIYQQAQNESARDSVTLAGGPVDTTPQTTESSRHTNVENHRKSAHNFTPQYSHKRQYQLSPVSPHAPSPASPQLPSRRRVPTIDRDNLMDRYIALHAWEEELNTKIEVVEKERTVLAEQVAALQANLDKVEANKSDLEQEKDRVRAEKRILQSGLDEDEQLEFGFEAGRKMASKRLKLG